MILTVLLWAIVAVVVILAVLVLTPVRLHARVSTAPSLAYRADVRVLGGMAPPIPIVDSARPGKPKTKRSKKKKVRKKSGFRFSGGAAEASAFSDFLAGLLRAIHFEHLSLDAEFGLPDPADTGQLYGCLTPLQFVAPLPQNTSVSLRPNFGRACFGVEADATLRFTVVALLLPVIRFAWAIKGPGT